jgi:hypothetical protein
VVSSRKELEVEQASLSIEDLIKGNVAKSVLIKEPAKTKAIRRPSCASSKNRPALVAGFRRDQKQLPLCPTPPVQPQNRIVLLKAADGTRALPVSQIQSVTFLDDVNDTVRRKQQKDTMTLHLDWKGKPPAPKAEVGMAYVQRGIRWIPAYRVEIDGKGKAVLKLQACIINELADLNDIKAHLVVGVPNFAFKEVVDPISFQEAAASLSGHSGPTTAPPTHSPTRS